MLGWIRLKINGLGFSLVWPGLYGFGLFPLKKIAGKVPAGNKQPSDEKLAGKIPAGKRLAEKKPSTL